MKLFFGSKAQKKSERKSEQPKPETSPEPPKSTESSASSPHDALKALKEISAALAEVKSITTPGASLPDNKSSASASEDDKKKAHDRSLFKSLLGGLYDAVLIFDSRGFVVGSNARAEQFFGYGESELWNVPCDKLMSAFNMRVLSKLRTYANAGRFTVVNATCTRKDGTTFPAEIAVSQINLLNEGDFIFSIRNLERREKARERHEMEIDALEYAGAGIVVCRADGLIAFANPAFVRLLRLAESKDVLNHFIGDFCTSYEAANALMKTPSAHGSWFGRLELRVATGETVETLATATQSQRKKEGAANIVLTLTPLPKAVV